MGKPKRRKSDRAGRPGIRSPGRPPGWRREHRQRFWAAIARGATSEATGVEGGVSPAVGVRWFREGGGMPAVTQAAYSNFYEISDNLPTAANDTGLCCSSGLPEHQGRTSSRCVMRCVSLILRGLLAIVAVAACGTSRSKPHSHLVPGCEPILLHRYGCAPTPAHTLSCGLDATPASLASEVAAANPGEVVCLASGDYSSFTGTSKSTPGITITSAPRAMVTFNSGITLDVSTVRNVTLDGTGGGGTMSVGGELDMETRGDALQDKTLNLAFQNINFAAGGTVLIRGPENSNITFNRDTFVAANANCSGSGGTSPSGLSGIFYLPYSTATKTTQSGVTVENSVFVAPADLWNPYRAMQTGSPLTVENNVFVGFLDHTEAASCNHIDTLQLFSGTPGTYGDVTFTGNLCYDDYGCIMAFDGTSDNTITDNVCFDIEQNCVILYSDSGSVVNHNTQRTGGADPSRCATGASIQACTSSVLFENGHKTGDSATTGETYTNNIDASGPSIGDSGSVTTNRKNMWSGASAPNISGSATFTGGSDPTTWAGFELTSGSPGHAGGSDGLDVGIRGSVGGPPTGRGSAPTNILAPSLTGTATEGDALTTTNGSWAITGNVPTAITYQWYDCATSTFSAASCMPIQPHTYPTSANNPTYTLHATDVGDYVFSEITLTNANGQIDAVSNPVGPVAS